MLLARWMLTKMASYLENIQLAFAFCKIGIYTLLCRLCCSPPLPTPEFSVICLGLTKAGKTTLLSHLAKEDADNIESTPGFHIKAIRLKNCILNVKEIGGGDKVRAYWRHYFKGSQAVLYVVDAACVQADWAVTHQLFRDTASHPALRGIPWLVLANCQDKRDARSAEQVSRQLDVQLLLGDGDASVQPSSRADIPRLAATLETLGSSLISASRTSPSHRDAKSK